MSPFCWPTLKRQKKNHCEQCCVELHCESCALVVVSSAWPYCVLSLPHCVWFHSGFVKHYLGSCICLVLIWRVSVKSKSVPLVRVAAINLFKLISCRRWCGQSQVIGRCRLVHGKDGTAWPKTVPSGTSKVLDYPFHGGLKARRSGDPEHGRLQWNWILKRPQAFTFAKKEGRFVR